MTIEEMRELDSIKTYKELEEAKSEIERLRKANFQLREGAEEQKQHIKRLEEAGDAMINEGWNEPHLANAWRKAKEAKS